MPTPNPPWLYHITAIPNLVRIAVSGRLLAKNALLVAGQEHANIAYENIQDRRSRILVPLGPGGSLHDYVPFHYAPRQPMLGAINQGNVAGCDYRQQDIVHFLLRADRIAEANLPFVIANHHPVTVFAEWFDELEGLDQIDWNMFFNPPLLGGYAKWFHNPPNRPEFAKRKEVRQAEFLVRDHVPIDQIVGIGVLNDTVKARVEAILAGCGWAVQVRAKPEWYH